MGQPTEAADLTQGELSDSELHAHDFLPPCCTCFEFINESKYFTYMSGYVLCVYLALTVIKMVAETLNLR